MPRVMQLEAIILFVYLLMSKFSYNEIYKLFHYFFLTKNDFKKETQLLKLTVDRKRICEDQGSV